MRRCIIAAPIVSLRPWLRFEDLADILNELLADLYGTEPPVAPGATIVIKPNVTANAPASSGGTTHVELVEALVEVCKGWNPGRLVVAEGTAAYGATHESAFPTGGWREMAARQGIELYNLDAGEHVIVPLENPRYPHELPISKLVLDADLYITVPLPKTHISADYTVALKNSYCLTPQVRRTEIHRQYLLEEALVDINRIRPADLVVVDGWEGTEGFAGGTDFDRPAGAHVMFAGTDPVAVDVIARELMCFTERTRYLEWAIEDGVGCGDREAITVLGPSMEGLCRRFLTPVGQLCEHMPGLHMCDGDACSGCRVPAVSALRRTRPPRLIKPITVVFGKHAEAPDTEGPVLVLGDCAAAQADLGIYIPGCPPESDAVYRAVREMGCLCQLCRETALEALEGLPESLLADVRVTAAGDTIFTGAQAGGMGAHRALIVGDCSASYARAVRDRAPSMGTDPDRDVLFISGCPAESSAIRDAILRAWSRS